MSAAPDSGVMPPRSNERISESRSSDSPPACQMPVSPVAICRSACRLLSPNFATADRTRPSTSR
jgi:hypothetical protein